MAILLTCGCGQALELPDDAAGREAVCPACHRRFTVGAPGASPQPPPASRQPAAGQPTAGRPSGGHPSSEPPPLPVAQLVHAAAAVRPEWGVVRCWQCQSINEASAETCAACGAMLPPPGQIPPSYWTAPARMPLPASADGGVSALIPYRNVPALVGYYLAIFSLVPCLGILLGIPAVVLGILGILRAQHQPEARGKVHAWFALVFGLFCVVGQIAAIILFMANPDLL